MKSKLRIKPGLMVYHEHFGVCRVCGVEGDWVNVKTVMGTQIDVERDDLNHVTEQTNRRADTLEMYRRISIARFSFEQMNQVHYYN